MLAKLALHRLAVLLLKREGSVIARKSTDDRQIPLIIAATVGRQKRHGSRELVPTADRLERVEGALEALGLLLWDPLPKKVQLGHG